MATIILTPFCTVALRRTLAHLGGKFRPATSAVRVASDIIIIILNTINMDRSKTTPQVAPAQGGIMLDMGSLALILVSVVLVIICGVMGVIMYMQRKGGDSRSEQGRLEKRLKKLLREKRRRKRSESSSDDDDNSEEPASDSDSDEEEDDERSNRRRKRRDHPRSQPRSQPRSRAHSQSRSQHTPQPQPQAPKSPKPLVGILKKESSYPESHTPESNSRKMSMVKIL